MKDINNLLDRLKGIQRDIAADIFIQVKHTKGYHKNFTVDNLCEKHLTDRKTIYFTLDKLGISEVVKVKKPKRGVYEVRLYDSDSFFSITNIFEKELSWWIHVIIVGTTHIIVEGFA